ncbi:MAG: galactose-1-phosphate uridylyltransferase, partial [Lachnospiraceae bacterium]|nr:galactose-1-phosphate uridylyltransferase [Lachnospiraceae bacterium]
MIQKDIRKLVRYGVQTGLVPAEDMIFTTNRLLELFKLDDITEEALTMSDEELSFSDKELENGEELEKLLGRMMDYA